MKYLYVRAASFRSNPLRGSEIDTSWLDFANQFLDCSRADTKDAGGAWVGAEFRDGVKREDHLIRCWTLVADIDEGGDVRKIADRLRAVSAIVHETFSSTSDAPRCRIVFELARPCSAAEYRAAHAAVSARLIDCGIVPDRACCDPGRLSFVPLRPPGATYLVEVTRGRPIDAVAYAARHPLSVETYVPADSTPRNLSRVQTVALEREADGVRATGAGQRHAQMLVAALRVFRPQLQIAYNDGEAALLPAFLAATNGSRKSEGIRILRDAWRKNRG